MAESYAGELAGSSTTTENPTQADDTQERERVQREFLSRFKMAKSHWKDWRTEARTLYDFIAGRQWSDEDLAKLEEEQRPIVTFNIAGKYMDAITGLQINNRQEIRYFPRTNGAAKVNELMTGAVAWCRDLSNMIDEETDGFYDSVLTGLGWMEGYLDKDLEPQGVAAGRRVDNMEMLPDPNARQRNLEDAKFVIRDRMMDMDEYEELFGEYADTTTDEGVSVEDKAADIDTEDTGIQVIPSPHDYGDSKGDTGERVTKGKCPVQDYQFWRREKRFVVKHPQAGQRELTTEEYAAQKEQLDMLLNAGQPISVDVISKKVYYRAYFSKGKMGPFGESPYQDGFTYHAITGKRDRNKRSWYGLGRAMIDSQNWTNKFFSTILYCLMTGAKGGLLAEEGAFKDSRKAESEWANPNSITWMKQGALSGVNGSKIMPKPVAQYPAGLDRLMEFTLNSLPQTTGMNLELMGLADRDQSGVLEKQRKQSAMSIIAWAFDAMRRYYRSIGRQMARYVTEYMPEGMLVKINGQDSAQYVPLVKDQLALTFDVIVDEAPTSTNMRERVWAVIENLVPQLLHEVRYAPRSASAHLPSPEPGPTRRERGLPRASVRRTVSPADSASSHSEGTGSTTAEAPATGPEPSALNHARAGSTTAPSSSWRGLRWATSGPGTRVHQYHDPDRLFINHYEEDDNLATNSLGGADANPGGLVTPYVDHAFWDEGNPYWLWQETDGLVAGWTSTTARYEMGMPNLVGMLICNYPYVSFRVGQNYEPVPNRNTVGQSQDFSVQLQLAQPSATLAVSKYDTLPYPLVTGWFPGDGSSTKTILKTVRIPLRTFLLNQPALDLQDITRLDFLFNRKPTGLLSIDDVQITH